MGLAETLQEDMKNAMRAKDSDTLGTLRMLKSEIRNKEIDAQTTLGDDQIQAVIKSMVKKRRESAQAYRDGSREELAIKEEQEIETLQAYLPAELGDEAIATAIDEVLANLPENQHQFGPVMGQVMKKLQGQADGSRVNAILKEKLN